MCYDEQCLIIGAGGSPGLTVSSDFVNGSSGKSATFDNEILSGKPDFKILSIEVWSLV